jgi:hypothetical protein
MWWALAFLIMSVIAVNFIWLYRKAVGEGHALRQHALVLLMEEGAYLSQREALRRLVAQRRCEEPDPAMAEGVSGSRQRSPASPEEDPPRYSRRTSLAHEKYGSELAIDTQFGIAGIRRAAGRAK